MSEIENWAQRENLRYEFQLEQMAAAGRRQRAWQKEHPLLHRLLGWTGFA